MDNVMPMTMTIIPIITWNIHYFPIVLRASIEKTLYICTMYIHSAFCNFLGRCIWKLVIFGIKLSWKNMNQDSQDILWSDGIRGWPGRSVQSPSMEENFENVLSVYFTSQSFRLSLRIFNFVFDADGGRWILTNQPNWPMLIATLWKAKTFPT